MSADACASGASSFTPESMVQRVDPDHGFLRE